MDFSVCVVKPVLKSEGSGIAGNQGFDQPVSKQLSTLRGCCHLVAQGCALNKEGAPLCSTIARLCALFKAEVACMPLNIPHEQGWPILCRTSSRK